MLSGVVCCILSILGISFSLQSNRFLDVPLYKLYAMRTAHYFSFKTSAVISIMLVVLTTIGYLFNQIAICICSAVSSIVFCIYVLCTEIPYLSMQEKALFGIIKNRIIAEYNKDISNDDYQMAEYNYVLEQVICNKDVKWVYNILHVPGDKAFNKFLLLRLLDVQETLAFHLNEIDNKKRLYTVTDGMLNTACDMTNGSFDITGILGEKTSEYIHQITRVLFRLLDNMASKEKTEDKLAGMVSWCFMTREKEPVKWDLYFSVIMIMTVEKVKKGDFSLLSRIKKELSLHVFNLRRDVMTSSVFLMISFVLYYLAEVEHEVPRELKEQIKAFIGESGIRNNTVICSWKELFEEYSRNFAVSYRDFISDYRKNKYYLEFSLESSHAHCVVFTEELATDWYLSNFFNSNYRYFCDMDYSKEFATNNTDGFLHHLKQIEDNCYPNREFVPTEKMIEMAGFHRKSTPKFLAFSTNEKFNHTFRDYIDKLRIAELETNIDSANTVSKQNIVDLISPQIVNKIQSEFGYSDKIDLSDTQKKSITIITERYSEAVNFNEFLVDGFTNNLFYDISQSMIRDNTIYTVVADDTFAESVANIVDNEFAYVTDDMLYHDYSLISDENVREQFDKNIKSAGKIPNSCQMFWSPTVILKDGFSFNCECELRVTDLTTRQLDEKVDEYRRADGQYAYQGTFLTREEVARYIQQTYIVLHLVYSYKVKTYPKSVIGFDMYPEINKIPTTNAAP